MGEHLAEKMLKTAEALHFLGKYDESNAAILMSRLLRAKNLDTLDKLESFVAEEEAKGP